MDTFETIDNHRLIYNGLEHVEFELTRSTTSYFRVAREAHQVLYRSIIASLRGTSNLSVTGKPSGRREHRYQFNQGSVQEIHKQTIPGCKKAWRFSAPITVQSHFQGGHTEMPSEDFLIPFYDALAMVQADCFMHRFVDSIAVKVSDQEMSILEWLHEAIRNEYEHFVPKAYSSPIKHLLQAAQLAILKAYACLLDSNNVSFYSHSVTLSNMECKLNSVMAIIDSHFSKAAGEPWK
ncbi:MAG: hypothetical protein V1799_07345 [bacterium]